MAAYCVYSGGNGTGGAIAGSVPSSTDWTNAYTNIQAALAAITEAAGDIIYVAHDHNFNYTANYSIVPAAFIWIISIDRTNTTTATPTAGAKETATGAFTGTIQGSGYYYGITFTSGSTAAACLTVNATTTAGNSAIFNTCGFELTNSAATAASIRLSGGINVAKVSSYVNCRFKFTNTLQILQPNGSVTHNFIGCYVDSGFTKPSVLIGAMASTGPGVTVTYEGCDWTWATALQAISGAVSGYHKYTNCLVPSTITSATHGGIGALTLELNGCGTASNDYAYGYYKQDGSGIIQHDTGVYLTAGDAFQTTNAGTQQLSLKMIPSANIATAAIGKCFPLYSPWFNANVTATGSKTLSLKIGHSESVVLNSDQIGIEIEYMGDTNHPEFTWDLSAPIIGLTGSALTDTAEAWTVPATEVTKTHTLSKTVTINQTSFCRARIAVYKQTTNAVYVHPVLLVS